MNEYEWTLKKVKIEQPRRDFFEKSVNCHVNAIIFYELFNIGRPWGTRVYIYVDTGQAALSRRAFEK